MPGERLIDQARGIAIATVVSRVTGFARVAALTAVLGLGGVRQAFDVANTLPNTLFELLLGGVLSSTLVPLLVSSRDRALASRILTLTLLLATGLSLAAVAAAPWLVRAYNHTPRAGELALSVELARFFLPQMIFYALTAVITAILNSSGRFAAAAWAPVLNNVVVILTLLVYLAVPRIWVLGVGTTLGVVAMTVALLPALRATGFRWRLRLGLRGVGLRRIARLGSWVFVYVGATQVAYWVLTSLATAVAEQPTYTTAFTVWQLPHAVVAVSVITALLPRMSTSAAAGQLGELRADLDRGLRLAMLLLLPAVVAFVVLGRAISVVLFAHGATSFSAAERIGWVLAVFAVGLLPFSMYQLQARAFYALRDTRTPALVQCAVSAVLIVVDVIISLILPSSQRVFGLAAGHALAYVVGVLISAVMLRGRIGPSARSSYSRPFLAALLSALAALGVTSFLPSGLLLLLVGGSALVLVYFAALFILRVPELSRLRIPRRG